MRSEPLGPIFLAGEWTMLDAVADIAEPRMEASIETLSTGVPAQEARDAILKAFPYEGTLRVRQLWSKHGVTRCRANWFREVEGEIRVVRTLFLAIAQTADGLVVRDETAG